MARIRLLISVLLGVTYGAWADIAIITHPGNSLSSIALVDVKRIFLRQATEFIDGNRVIPGTLPMKQPISAEFSRTALGMTDKQLQTYWAQYIFTGERAPPQELPNTETMRLWVANTEGALGFIDVEAVDDSVKVLRTISSPH